MLILAGVVAGSGLQAIETAKRTAFISEMEIIQAKVNTIYEEIKSSNEKLEYYNKIGQDISTINNDKINMVLTGSNISRL